MRYINVAYTIAEISELIKLSKVSIYKKLKLKELEEHITKCQGITYIDDIGFNIIKDSFNINDKVNLNKNVKTKSSHENNNKTIDDEIATDTEGFNINEELFNMLKYQLKEKDNQLNMKDKQLQELNERLKQAHKLIENNQILLKEKPKQEILLLEEHFQALDNKFTNIRQDMQERKEPQKGFLKRMFKK